MWRGETLSSFGHKICATLKGHKIAALSYMCVPADMKVKYLLLTVCGAVSFCTRCV